MNSIKHNIMKNYRNAGTVIHLRYTSYGGVPYAVGTYASRYASLGFTSGLSCQLVSVSAGWAGSLFEAFNELELFLSCFNRVAGHPALARKLDRRAQTRRVRLANDTAEDHHRRRRLKLDACGP